MTSAFSRYAVYAMADPQSPLFLRASRWLGWDGVAAAALTFPEAWELENPRPLDIELVTRTPRKYGFHGTIKPPMRLAEGYDEAILMARASKLASALAPVTIPTMEIAAIGRFLALVPAQPNADLADLAGKFVTGLDDLRRPADEAELDRRRGARLSAPRRTSTCLRISLCPRPVQVPYDAEWTTGPDDLPMAKAMLEQWIGPVIPEPFILDRLAIMGEALTAGFRLVSWVPLMPC